MILFPLLFLWHKIRARSETEMQTSYAAYLQNVHDITFQEIFKRGAFLTILYTIAGYLYYSALPQTSVSVGAAIYNTSVVAVYILSILFLHEKWKLHKSIGIAAAVGGVVLLSTGKGLDGETSKWSANLLVAASAILYASYEVTIAKIMKKQAKSPEVITLVTASMGFSTAILWLVVTPVLSAVPTTGWCHEHFDWPSQDQIYFLALNAMLAIIFNVTLMLSISSTSPLVVSITCVTTIPVAAIFDYCLHGTQLTMNFVWGSLLIIVGFSITIYRPGIFKFNG